MGGRFRASGSGRRSPAKAPVTPRGPPPTPPAEREGSTTKRPQHESCIAHLGIISTPVSPDSRIARCQRRFPTFPSMPNASGPPWTVRPRSGPDPKAGCGASPFRTATRRCATGSPPGARLSAAGSPSMKRAASSPGARGGTTACRRSWSVAISTPRRRAGRFDGILGVLAGLEILRTLDDNGIATKRPIEVVDWTNEEGARFAPPMAASRVFAGLQTVEWLHDLKDDDGIRYGDELRRIGYLGEAPVGGRPLDSYFELHIEQDSLMEERGVSVGVVTGGYYSHALTCVFHGECAHTGPTEMKKRRNAMIGAAYFLAAVNDIGWEYEPVGRHLGLAHADLAEPVRHPAGTRRSDRRYAPHGPRGHRRDGREDARGARPGGRKGAGRSRDYRRVDLRRRGVRPRMQRSVCATRQRRAASPAWTSAASPATTPITFSRIAPTALVFSPCVGGITHNEAEDILFEPTIEAVKRAARRRPRPRRAVGRTGRRRGPVRDSSTPRRDCRRGPGNRPSGWGRARRCAPTAVLRSRRRRLPDGRRLPPEGFRR